MRGVTLVVVDVVCDVGKPPEDISVRSGVDLNANKFDFKLCQTK